MKAKNCIAAVLAVKGVRQAVAQEVCVARRDSQTCGPLWLATLDRCAPARWSLVRLQRHFITYLLPIFMLYRVRCLVWQMEAESPVEAKKKVVELMKSQAEHLISVEVQQPKHGLWYSFITGR